MDENVYIKNELFLIYNEITKYISNNKKQTNKIKINEDINSLTLVNYIKELIPLLINKNNDNKKLREHYFQLENQLIKLENESKNYLKKYFQCKILKDAFEIQLNNFKRLEEEFNELKNKVKYEKGKFLENDRKDNEIVILKKENSALKKEIKQLENNNRIIENQNKDFLIKIKEYKNSIESLKAKISQLEIAIKEKTIKNYWLFKTLSKNNSCSYFDNPNNNSIGNFDNSSTNHSIFNLRLKKLKKGFNSMNNPNSQKTANISSLKYNGSHIEYINNNSNNITMDPNNTLIEGYGQMVDRINNNNKKEIIFKNDNNKAKTNFSKSISILHGENDDSRHLLLNKNFYDKNDKYYSLEKTGIKTRNLNRIIRHREQGKIIPLNRKNITNRNISQKYIQKHFYKNIINKSHLNTMKILKLYN